MKKLFVRFAGALFTALFFSSPAMATETPLSLAQSIALSDLLIEGRVSSRYCFRGERGGLLYTAHVVEVFKVFKGETGEGPLEVVTAGGALDGEALLVFPSLELQAGQSGLFQLRRYTGSAIDNERAAIWRPVSAGGGLIAYPLDADGPVEALDRRFDHRQALYDYLREQLGRPLAEVRPAPERRKNAMAPLITGLSPTVVNGGVGAVITITGSGFGPAPGSVFFDDPDDGPGGFFSSALSSQILSWSDTEITVVVPADAGSGSVFIRDINGVDSPVSNARLTIRFSQINTGGGEEIEMIDEKGDGNGGYTFFYSTNTAGGGVDLSALPAATAAIERAVATWNSNTAVPFFAGLACGTTSVQVPNASMGDDGVNLIAFDSEAWDLDVEASVNTLGVAYVRFLKCGASNWELFDIDIILRRNGDPNGAGGSVNWNYGPGAPGPGQVDFETVVLHELGHAHLLKHVNDAADLMFPSVTAGTAQRTLGQGNADGGNYVLSHSLAYNPPLVNCLDVPEFSNVRDAQLYDPANDCAQVLPVELTAFTGRRLDGHVRLDWRTASELNNEGFTVERSADGRAWRPIAFVPGANEPAGAQYHYRDEAPLPGLSYYRLEQRDFDGQTDFSPVIALQAPAGADRPVVYPVPVRDRLQVRLGEGPPPVFYQVRDAFGRLLAAGTSGEAAFSISAEAWPPGLFYLVTERGGERAVIRFQKQ